MANAIHYKYADVDGLQISFCELGEDFYPSKYTSKKNKIKPLRDDATLPDGFCSLCRESLENQELIDKE